MPMMSIIAFLSVGTVNADKAPADKRRGSKGELVQESFAALTVSFVHSTADVQPSP